MEDLNNILVFATNIRTPNDKKLISESFNKHSQIQEWNVDQEDIDCVLRVVSETLSEKEIIIILENHNFKCTSLE
jgi:hypothetical protein